MMLEQEASVTEPTYKRVCRVIADLAATDADRIGPGQSLGQKQTPNFYWHSQVKGAPLPAPIGFDSLDLVQLAMNLEEEFAITISDSEVDSRELDHVGGLVAFVQGKLDAKPKPRTYGDISPAIEEWCRKHPVPGIIPIPIPAESLNAMIAMMRAAETEIRRVTDITPIPPEAMKDALRETKEHFKRPGAEL
jgi:acyl carrier protein